MHMHLPSAITHCMYMPSAKGCSQLYSDTKEQHHQSSLEDPPDPKKEEAHSYRSQNWPKNVGQTHVVRLMSAPVLHPVAAL